MVQAWLTGVRGANKPVLVTAARWRFGLNVKGYGSGGGPRRRALGSQTNEGDTIMNNTTNHRWTTRLVVAAALLASPVA